MRTAILTFVLLLALARPLQAQHSNGYVFLAPRGISCVVHTAIALQLGVGGEGALGKGIGVGAEVGAVGTRQYFGIRWLEYSPQMATTILCMVKR